MPGYQVPLTTVDANTTINNQKLVTTGNDIGKNYIINGGFDIWQRGASLSMGQGYCGPDRWKADFAVAALLGTWERGTFAPGQTEVPGNPKYYWRINVTSTNGSATMEPANHIEDVNTLAGEVVTLSFWARINSGTRSIAWVARQNFGTSGSAAVDTSFGTALLTTSWQKFTYTTALPSISGKTVGVDSSLRIFSYGYASPTGAYQIDYANIQLERGSNATPFSRAGGTIQGELSACQRYYERITGDPYTPMGVGQCGSTTSSRISVPMKVTKRNTPSFTSSVLSGFNIWSSSFAGLNLTNLTAVAGGKDIFILGADVASGLIAGNSTQLLAAGISSAYIEFSSEF
jgi:hypothetical protein